MVVVPRPFGTLAFFLAWVTPWRPSFCVRAGPSNLAFHLHRRDAIGRHIAKYGTHEPLVSHWIADYLANALPGIVVDVGANIGWHALHAAGHRNVEKVVAFEPDPLNVTLLERSIARNAMENVIVDDRAVGARSGTVRFHRYKGSNSGRHSVTANYGFGSVDVGMTDLDSALDGLGLGDRRVCLIKIDVEGYEPAVIAGASRTIARTDAIILEYCPQLSREGGLSTETMRAQLYDAGFSPFGLRKNGKVFCVVPEDFSDFENEGSVDLIWFNTEIARKIGGADRDGMTLYQIAVQNKDVKAI